MVLRPLWGKLIIISFMILIGFSLARAVYSKSIMGILLSLVSLGAAIYFVHMAAQPPGDWEEQEETA